VFFDKILTKIFGTSNERAIKRLTPMVGQINALELEIKQLTDEQLREKTVEFRARIAKKPKKRHWRSCFPRRLP
jgi:preprotein translocase subunit SecA